MKYKFTKVIIPILLIALGFTSRLLPHPANFAPIGAIALFAGMYLPKKWAIVLPLAVMFVSDIFIGFYSWQIMLAVYASFALVSVIGLVVRNNNHASSAGKKILNVFNGTLLGSILFFLITNGAVWMFGTMYIHNLSGLMQSYISAIPFFRNSLFGDLFYVGLMVGGFEALSFRASRVKATTRNPFPVN
jgi:hypothetical protein